MRRNEVFGVADFHCIRLKDYGDLFLIPSDREELRVEADAEVLAKLKVEVINGCLEIGFKGDWLDRFTTGIATLGTTPIRLELEFKQLDTIDVVGAAKVFCQSFACSKLNIRVGGAGLVEMDKLTAAELVVGIPGAGKVEVNGSAQKLDVNLSGAGTFQGQHMAGTHVSVLVSGIGNAAVWAEETLKVNVSGLGGVQYRGNPQVQSNISGVGRLTQG